MAEQWMPGAARQPQPGGVTLNTDLPRRATWHITWDAVTDGNQPPMANVSNYLKNQGYCPHLMWDPFTGDVIQYYPANVGGRALNAWNEDGAVNIQIETYFSPGVTHNGRAYQTVAETPCKGLDKILAWLDSHGIPRVWPMGAPQWQGNSRDVDIWNSKAGHYGHCNVPGNTHTDPGPMPSLGKAGGTKPQGSTITPSAKDWFDMASKEEVKAALREVFGEGADSLPSTRRAGTRDWVLFNTREHAMAANYGAKANGKLLASIAAQTAAIKALAESKPGLDASAVQASIDKAVQAALKDLTVTLSTEGA